MTNAEKQTDLGVASAAPISIFSAHNKINTDTDILKANIASNMVKNLPFFWPEEREKGHIHILAGGPSAALYHGEKPLMTAGSAHKYAEKHGFEPDFAVFLDAKENNAQFVTKAFNGCRYLVASQCAPEFVDHLLSLGAAVELWHAQQDTDDDWFSGQPAIFGYSTTTLRCFNICILLGLTNIHVYGFDSSYSADGILHPYNHFDKLRNPTIVHSPNGRKFMCEPWQIKQAEEALNMVDIFHDMFNLTVYGEGLVADMLGNREV